MRRRILLLIWTLGILFPIAWIGGYSPKFSPYFEAVLSPEWVHVVMHVILYAGFTILILYTFDLQPTLKVFGLVLSIGLAVGVVQEIIQQVSSHIPHWRWNSLLDLGVDLGGAIIGFAAVVIFRRYRRTH